MSKPIDIKDMPGYNPAVTNGVDDETSEGKCEWDAMNAAGDAIRAFYEAKITSGELMVVKTAELWHPSVPEEEWKKWLTGSDAEFSMLVTKCCSKNPWCPPWGHGKGVWNDKEHIVEWPRLIYVCPGCGAKINRP